MVTESAESAAKYWSTKVPEGPFDYIVIGSGMGGMTAAALLAKLGRRVLVLEQHYVPGGFTHMFRRKKYVWDVGVHAVGEVSGHSALGRLLARLTDQRLEWASLGPVYDEFYFPDGFRIDFPDHPAKFRQNLIDAFPGETRAIDDYLHYVKEVAGGMRGYYLARTAPRAFARAADRLFGHQAQKYLELRTRDVVAGLTRDERLRALFTAQWGYYGSPPSRSSFAIQALVVKHFMHGGYYPVGGSREIARNLLRTVAEAGGWTCISTDVDQILIEGGKAVGVRLKDGLEVRAGRVISAAGVVSTVRRLLPEPYRGQDWALEVDRLPPAPAHVCLYLGFKGDIRQGGASPANKWFYGSWDPEAAEWDVRDPAHKHPAPVLYCSFPSLKDPRHDPGLEQLHTGEVVTFVPWDTFAPWQGKRWRHRGADYEALKKDLEQRLLEQFLENMPLLRPMVDYVELSTPISTDHFVRPIQGSIYGIEPTPERFKNQWLRARAPVRNLFFAGSEVASVGVMGAMVGGVLAATSAEPIAALRFLRKT